MERYFNRKHAGQILANNLTEYANRDDVLVLGLPRGGLPVAYEVSKALNLPLDVFIVRKLGVPGHVELAMGALAVGDVLFLNEHIIRDLHIPQTEINYVIEQEKKEIQRRQLLYRGSTRFPSLKNKIVILIDDGIATGATIRAAINALKSLESKEIVVAIPVADRELCTELSQEVNKVICPLMPPFLYAVGAWYEDFSQTEDEEVQLIMSNAKKINEDN